MFAELVNTIHPAAVIETGTFRGATTAHLRAVSGAPVYSVEAIPRFHHSARRRLRRDPGIRLAMADSRTFLRALALDPAVPKVGVVFYLDAHWYADLPLQEELQIIAAHWKHSVVIIDDFQVDGDRDYVFDDYGPGKSLTLADIETDGFTVFWPARSSKDETGLRRGSVVLAQAGVERRLRVMTTLRSA
jgi:hypothetical protein